MPWGTIGWSARIARRVKVAHLACHGVRHGMRDVNSRVAECDACQRRRPHHLLAGFAVRRVDHRAFQIAPSRRKASPRRGRSTGWRPDSSGACSADRRQRGRDEGPRGEGLECVRQHVESAAGDDWRAGWVQSGSTSASVGRSAGEAIPVLTGHRRQVEDRDAGDLATRARRRRTGDVRLERPRHRCARADRRVDVLEEVGGIGWHTDWPPWRCR